MGLLRFITKQHRDKQAQTGESKRSIEVSKKRLDTANRLSYDTQKVQEELNYELRVKNHVSERFKEALKGRL